MAMMIAYFADAAARDNAVRAAQSVATVRVEHIGDIKGVENGVPSDEPPEPVAIFDATSLADVVFFTNRGAFACLPV